MRYLYSVFLFFLVSCADGQKQRSANSFLIPKPTDLVSDFEGFFSPEQKKKIIEKIDSVNALGKIKIGLATFDSTYVRDSLFGEFALKVANSWGIGDPRLNNGIFICISFQMKNIQIKTGIGIEKFITNEMADDILDRIILPAFRAKKFSEGVIAAINELSRLSMLYIK